MTQSSGANNSSTRNKPIKTSGARMPIIDSVISKTPGFIMGLS
jgi:hypothetical protein